MNEISSITSHRLRSKAEVSFVETITPMMPTPYSQEISPLQAEALKFKEGLEMAQSIQFQLEKAIDTIIPEQ